MVIEIILKESSYEYNYLCTILHSFILEELNFHE